MEEELKRMVSDKGLNDYVIFHGEQSNPYRFMKNADLFLLTSYHEAAPMVIDESYILGVPVLTTRTNSSDEMVTARNCGWVCENDQEALNTELYRVLNDRDKLAEIKCKLASNNVDNKIQLEQFDSLIEG